MSTVKKPKVTWSQSAAAADKRKERPYVCGLDFHYKKISKAEKSVPEWPEESIFTQKVADVPEKMQRYVSKFRPQVLVESKANKMAMRTMGPAKVEVEPYKSIRLPKNKPKLPERVPHVCSMKKPPVPLCTEHPPVLMKPKRNFLKTMQKLKKVTHEPAFIDIKGHRQILKDSGYVPVYAKKEDYGKIPKYLVQLHKEKLKKTEEEYSVLKHELDKMARKLMSDAEREYILKGLRKTWKKVHSDYQLLPFVLETFSMLARKDRLEKELCRLEANIALFESSRPIYLERDDLSDFTLTGPRSPTTSEHSPTCPSEAHSTESS
ncbi:enkurin-like isoform X1 [Paralichthys olivaceus]|uniref:enkurin-like isoform X1 n=1 Tax=Paralichthys olivaceus TaxID=8255 RepID=UPI003752937A